MHRFSTSDLKKLYRPGKNSTGEDNDQITIVGGSELFHGAPLLALITASRIVDTVFFATPEKSVGYVAEQIKSKLFSFIWIPWKDREQYIEKSDAILIGPGFMRFGSEKNKNIECDEACERTKKITRNLLKKFPEKKWVIDAGSLQVIDPEILPKGCIVTPNKKEYKYLFGNMEISDAAKKYNCVIVNKAVKTLICDGNECVEISGGNPGMTKGGTGDILAGLTVALLAKNDPLLAASAASFIAKKAADELYKKRSIAYSADDLASQIPLTFGRLLDKI